VKARNLLVTIAVLVAAWQALAMTLRLDVLPTPAVVLWVFARELPGELGRHLLWSTLRTLASIALAVGLATPLGLALGQSKSLSRLLSPLIYILYPIPKIVFLPIVLLFLGIGNTSKIFLITLILWFQVLVVVKDQAGSIRPELIHSVRSLGGGRRALFRFVYLPACLPAVLTAIRVSIGTAIAVLFFAESFATTSGLGYYIIVETWGRLDYASMYAGVVAMSLLGLVLFFAVDRLERRLCPWTVGG
jgi:ABC-type nitrate/sulfonate/bicarbonate transport system permease component